jgi:phage shock protein A
LLQSGELEGERDAVGHWSISARVVHTRLERLRRESLLEAVGYDPSSVREMRELVEVLRAQVEMLREELDEAHAANRENRRIIAALTSRIPAIEAPESPEPRSGTGTPTDASAEAQEATERAEERSWWRRMFGGS